MASHPPMVVGLRLILGSASVALTTLVLLNMGLDLQQATASLLFILVVLLSALVFGLLPGLLAALLAFLSFNYFFVPAAHSFLLTDPQDALRITTFAAVAVITSVLAARVRTQAVTAARQKDELAALYDLSQAISAEVALDRILPRIAQTTTRLFQVPACSIALTDAAGHFVETVSHGVTPRIADRHEVALHADRRMLGKLTLIWSAPAPTLSSEQLALLETLANQVVLVIERASLADTAAGARALAESDRLKSALLSSVSHDLRTPLAVIKGAVTNLLDDDVGWDQAERRDLLSTIDEESDRLNRLVGDLLEMSRIEAGALQQARGWQDLRELIETVTARLRPRMAGRSLQISIPAELPPALISYAQIDHVLTNLIENALLYSPPETPLTIEVRLTSAEFRINVLDRGPGIPPSMLNRIFEKFVRAVGPELHAEGTGLGLAICKGIVEAHGGRIWAENRKSGGARLIFTLPRHQHNGTPDIRHSNALVAEAAVEVGRP